MTTAGTERTYLTTKRPYQDDRGRVVGMIGISRDITEYKRAEEDLRETQEFLSRLLDYTPAPIFAPTRDGRCRLINRAWEEFWRLTREEVIGRPLEEVLPPEHARRFLDQNREVIQTAAPLVLEQEVVAPDGRHYLYTVKFPLRNAANQIEAVGGISFVITERRRVEEALRESEAILRSLYDSAPLAMGVVELHGDDPLFVSANREMAARLGIAVEDLQGRYASQVEVAREELDFWTERFRESERLGGPVRFERSYDRHGVRRWIASTVTPIAGVCAGRGRFAFVIEEITERKRAEEALARDALLLANVRDSVIVTDMEGIITYWNEGATRLFGWRAEEMLGRPLVERVPEAARDRMAAATRAIGEGEEFVGEWEDYRKDGSRIWIEARVARISDASGRPIALMGLSHDISDRKRAEEALRGYAERLQVLSRRVVEVQEEERCHLARELHDEIGQSLTAIGVNMQALRRACGPEGQPRIEECLGIVQRTIEHVRGLALDLRPSMLDDLGLVAALKWYLDGQARRVGYRSHFAAEPDEVSLGPAIAIAAFRVAQEALTNVARHAQAGRVWVRLRVRDGTLRLVVRDDGVGFDSEAVLRRGAPGAGLGLLGMRERAALLGGRFSIRSAPGRGTEVRLTLPLNRADERAKDGHDPPPDRR